MMKERPMLFSAPMIRALLAGRKTQTRRMVKPQPSAGFLAREIVGAAPQWPFQNGDRIWVRETFYNDIPESKDLEHLYYRADDRCCEINPECQCGEVGPVKWKPSIFMPRWASRITLEITGVRVERLQDISANDILAEGAVKRAHHNDYLGKMPVSAFDGKAYPDLKSLWAFGWESIYGKGSWGINPLVWVLEFKQVK